jgi:hypothetical protein
MYIKKHNLGLVLFAAVVALIPEYVMRSTLTATYFMYNHFSTYSGDLWYCFDNYLAKGFPYPREYPSGIQLLFKLLFLLPSIKNNYTVYMAVISSILSLIAIAITYVLYQLVIDSHGNTKKIWLLWILSPSYLFYGLLNLDFLAIITILLSYSTFIKGRHIQCGVWLALGTTIKVFPVFLLPLLFFSANKTQKKQLVISFILTWTAFNIPFMLTDFASWVFPYMWQIQENYSRTNHDGSWTWVIYQLFDHFGIGSLSGKISLVLFASGYIYFCLIKYRNLPLIQRLSGVMMLFILTDRVYSPQYNLYLLPFLVLVDYKVSSKYFYLFEIPNMLQVFFCFYFKANPILLQGLIAIKYFALIMLFSNNWQAKSNIETPKCIAN